jgi:DNA-binding CsgD family transcriptional regulator
MFCYNAIKNDRVKMKSFFTSLWQRLARTRTAHRLPQRTYQVDVPWIGLVKDWAEREQRPEVEIAADLLSYAIARREVAEAYLPCWQALSPREREVAALVCLNYTNRQIGERMIISHETVKSHLRHILSKFGMHSKTELRQALTDWDFSAWRDHQASLALSYEAEKKGQAE